MTEDQCKSKFINNILDLNEQCTSLMFDKINELCVFLEKEPNIKEKLSELNNYARDIKELLNSYNVLICNEINSFKKILNN